MFRTKIDMNFTNSEELHILKKITMLLSKAREAWLSSTEKDVPFNCHSVARALVNYLQNECIALSVTDGLKLGFGIDEDRNPTGIKKLPHSWIVLRNRNGNIIDPYPNGIISLSPLLILMSGQFSPYGGKPTQCCRLFLYASI